MSADKTIIKFGYNGGKTFVYIKANTVWSVKEGKTVAWQEGDGDISLRYSGNGNDLLCVSTEVNEGLDRVQDITIEMASSYVKKQNTISIQQIGKREIFNVTEGEFVLQNNENLNVLKYGIQ